MKVGGRQWSVVSKRVFRSALGALLLALCAYADAQQVKKMPHVGYLSAIDRATELIRIEAIRLALREIGYIEGQNIATEYRYADGNPARLTELAENLVRLKVDLIVTTGGDPVIRAAKSATKTIPIVMVGGGLNPSEQASLKALLVREATSPGLQTLARN